MPVERIPLVGVANQRSIDAQASLVLSKDQRFLNCMFDAVKNPITGKTTFYAEKRPGWNIRSLVSAGNVSTGLIKTDVLNTVVSAFGATNSTIYDEQTSVGTITGQAISFWETSLGAIGYVMIRSSDGTGWYYASDAKTTLSYTGLRTSGSPIITGLGDTTGIYSGQAWTGTGIPASTRVLTKDSATQITLNANATSGSGTSTVFTKEPIAKILDTDFVTTGSNLSGFSDLNGFTVYCTEDGYLYNSVINTVHSYAATDKIACNISPDLPAAVARHKNSIAVFKRRSTEFFSNKGNPAGSPFDSAQNLYKKVGIQNQRSLASLGDDIYFVSGSGDGDLQVERLRDFGISPVSTPEISKILGTANATGSAIYASAFTLGGYSYLMLQVVSVVVLGNNAFLLTEDASNLLQETSDKFITEAGTTITTGLTRELIYNIDLNLWSEWDSIPCTFVKGVGSGSINQVIASSILSTSGKIYQINPSSDTEVYADDGTAYSMIIQTSAFDFGTDKWKYVSALSWIGDKESSGTIIVETNDNDFDSSSWVTRGTIDLSAKQKKINGLGAHRGKRAYRFTHSANAACRGEAVDIEYTVGAT